MIVKRNDLHEGALDRNTAQISIGTAMHSVTDSVFSAAASIQRTSLFRSKKTLSNYLRLLLPEIVCSDRVWRKVPESDARSAYNYKECPFSGVTNSGRIWTKVPESDARSLDT